jgi:hypothetical protein
MLAASTRTGNYELIVVDHNALKGDGRGDVARQVCLLVVDWRDDGGGRAAIGIVSIQHLLYDGVAEKKGRNTCTSSVRN